MKYALTLSLLVGAGGFTGSLLRYILGMAAQRLVLSWPLGTLAALGGGCLLLGVVTAVRERP